jgi:mRNA-degrading endonuclease RelE of RelBE toxin-antitoxin system
MPNEAEPSPVPVEYTPEFKRNLRQLAKRYKRIKTDVQPLLDALGQGQTPGDQIPGVLYEVYKVRARNSDSGKGRTAARERAVVTALSISVRRKASLSS